MLFAKMQFKCIFHLFALFLAMESMFDHEPSRLAGVDAKLLLAGEGEYDWLLVDKQLNCVVKDEGFEEDPVYCWATKHGYGNYSPICVIAKSNDSIPKELKDIVTIDGEGM